MVGGGKREREREEKGSDHDISFIYLYLGHRQLPRIGPRLINATCRHSTTSTLQTYATSCNQSTNLSFSIPQSQKKAEMFTPGLTNTPITKLFLIYIVTSSIALSILDLKHLAGIHISPHFWGYGQFWRAAVWQAAGFANSTETLFACVLIYHLRVIERAWGGRKLVVCSVLPSSRIWVLVDVLANDW